MTMCLNSLETDCLLIKKFLPIVSLLRSSLSGVSCQGIECLDEAFFDAFISGRYAEVCSAEQSEKYTSTRIMINTIDFSDSEYSMVKDLFDAIRGIYIEKMCQCWVDGPKQPAKLSIERFSIKLSPMYKLRLALRAFLQRNAFRWQRS